MSKKIEKNVHTKDQTQELVDAHYEFILRNPGQKEKLDDVVNVICSCLKVSEDIAIKLIKADLYRWYRAARDGQYLLLESYSNFLDRLKNDDLPWQSNVYLRQRDILRVLDKSSNVVFEDEWMGQIMKDSATIIHELLLSSPSRRRLIVINLERTKEAIMAELDEVVTKALKEYQVIFGKEPFRIENISKTLFDPFFKRSNWSRVEKKDPFTADHSVTNVSILDDVKKKERLKWLRIKDELLKVWDLYEKAGQHPWLKTFRNISRKVGRPLSTVKNQWYLVYEKIFGEKYDPERKYTTEEKRRDADEICVKCPHGAECYGKLKPGDEWVGCFEYQKIAGKNKSVNLGEYKDYLQYGKPNPRKARKKGAE